MRRGSSGQLAVGLAIGFSCILAMLGLVFQTSLNTIEKTKLQTTSDYGALVAADVQRYNLNSIRRANQIIELAWVALEVQLNIPHCNRVITACKTAVYCVTAQTAVSMANVGTEVTNSASTDVCDQACDRYDANIKNNKVRQYKAIQTLLASGILSTVDGANAVAFERALNTFLDPKNLPPGLVGELQKTLGKGFTLSNTKDAYRKGELQNNPDYSYQILESSKNDPLFIPMQEQRTTYHSNFYYGTTYVAGVAVECIPTTPIGFPEKPLLMPFRITRNGDYTTHFFTGLKYAPPPTLIEKMVRVGVKNPDASDSKFGQEIGTALGKEKLFQRQSKNTYVMSAAKPYGGTFPEAGDISGNPLSLIKMIIGGKSLSIFGTSGTEFKGAKLFGIADSEEIGGQRITRADDCIPHVDNQGNEIGCVPYYAEDFLH